MYDVTLYPKPLDLMHETCSAIRGIRSFFSQHPLTKGVEIPKHLIFKCKNHELLDVAIGCTFVSVATTNSNINHLFKEIR